MVIVERPEAEERVDCLFGELRDTGLDLRDGAAEEVWR